MVAAFKSEYPAGFIGIRTEAAAELGKLDTNFLGYPTEGHALSNGIRAVMARPLFSDAAFQVGDKDTAITLHIRY